MTNRTSLLLGLATLVAIGLAARVVASLLPIMNYLIVAILIGILVGNTYGIPAWGEVGIKTHKLWLEAGIVVMGASIGLERVIAAGPTILALVVGTVLMTLLFIEVLARELYNISTKMGSLLASGSSICGVSAVVAVAGSIDPDERDIAYAAATILLFDSVTLLVYPMIGHVLGLSDKVFGLWAGLTMFSTGPVTAAGFAFSEAAGQWALLVKLTRNVLIGVAAIGYAIYYTHRTADETTTDVSAGPRFLWRTFPKFVLGFLAVMVVANAGMLGQRNITSLEHASNWLFMLAFAGLGLEIQFDTLRSTGLKPVLVVLTSLVILSTLELFVLTSLF